MYNDRGCDCRWQLLEALNRGYIVIHDPFADGRGWGTIPKGITELFKNGAVDQRISWHYPEGEMDTVQAALWLYGHSSQLLPPPLPIDIRTRRYRLMGEEFADVLERLNIEIDQIVIFTDNGEKVEMFSKGFQTICPKPIIVKNEPTNTQQHNPHCAQHIKAKYHLPQYVVK